MNSENRRSCLKKYYLTHLKKLQIVVSTLKFDFEHLTHLPSPLLPPPAWAPAPAC